MRTPDGKTLVVLELRTPAGEQTYFFEAEFVEVLAEHLAERARAARGTGLVIPRPQIPRDILGNGGVG